MENTDLDSLRASYKAAVDAWVTAIREEEALATPDHSMIQMERWDAAVFAQQNSAAKAKAAHDAYKDGLRLANYSI
jgi:Tfp pilus assembly protein PilN